MSKAIVFASKAALAEYVGVLQQLKNVNAELDDHLATGLDESELKKQRENLKLRKKQLQAGAKAYF